MMKYVFVLMILAGAAFALVRNGGEPLKKTSARIGSKKGSAVATFGAGCFWGVESEFRALKGVTATWVGYMGGMTKSPTYKEVCTDETGHAEVVHVEYDPKEISYDQLLEVFWNGHNPTTLNRQGPDIGTQYRSVIFYHDAAQRTAAEKSKKALEALKKWRNPVVTSIEPAKTFYAAEDYHQQYLEKRGQSSCHN
jgi:peptide-methionine (S)-S-oxide reductase